MGQSDLQDGDTLILLVASLPRYVLTCSFDGCARLFNSAGGPPIRSFSIGKETPVLARFINHDSKVVVGSATVIKLFDIETGECMAEYPTNRNDLEYAMPSPTGDGSRYVTISESNMYQASVVDAALDAVTLLNGHRLRIVSATFTPSGEQVITCSDGGTAKLFNAASGECVQTYLLPGDAKATMGELSPCGGKLVVGSLGGSAFLFDAVSGGLERELHGHTRYVMSLSFSGDGRTLATCGDSEAVKLWDVASGRCTKHWKPEEGCQHVVFAPGVNKLLLSMESGSCHLVDMESEAGTCEVRFDGQSSALLWAAFSEL